MFRVGWQIWPNRARERPAPPGSPSALFATRFIHPVGIVLKVNPGIADGALRRRGCDQPRHRAIREGKFAENGLLAGQIRTERPIKTEECPRRETLLPERVTILEAREVKFRAAVSGTKRMKGPPVEAAPGNRQVRARRKSRRHSRVGASEKAARQPRVGSPCFFRLAHRVVSARTEHLNASSANSSSSASVTPTPAPVHSISGWRRAVLWPFGMLMRLWGMSLRFDTSSADLHAYTKTDQPIAMVLWHNRLFLAAEIVRRYRGGRPAYALVSASQDGAWLTAFFSLAGVRTVRGSSSRLGREAATALVDTVRAGHDIGITPDGPRGPCYEMKPGGVIVARRTRAPILLIGGEFESAWRLRSWDRLYLPKPFSRVRMRGEIVMPDQLADRDAATVMLRERLLTLNPDHDSAG